jgi:hypothetical protein
MLWPNGGYCVAFNTSYLPIRPPVNGEITYICEDGFWGRREYTLEPTFFDHLSPHLAFFPVPVFADDLTHLAFRAPHEFDMRRTKNGQVFLSNATAEDVEVMLKALQQHCLKAKDWCARVYVDLPSGIKASSRRIRIFNDGRFPSAAEANAFEALNVLQHIGARGLAEFRLIWHAMQRFARELDAYIAFCACFLPHTAARRELSTLQMLPLLQRRGSIFSGADIDDWIGLFIDKDIPSYAVLWKKEYCLLEENRVDEPSSSPYSVIPDPLLSTSLSSFF